MIREVTMYRVECDAEDCDESPQSEEFYAWLQVDGALDDLSHAYNWYASEDGKHFCGEHAPVCAAPDCGLRLDNDEFGAFCEDHAPEEVAS